MWRDMKDKVDSICHILHGAIAGFITGLMEWFGLAVAIFIFIQFILYEVVEEEKIRDELYRELKEWVLGYVTGLVTVIMLKYLLLYISMNWYFPFFSM
jgi:hypothetical protein